MNITKHTTKTPYAASGRFAVLAAFLRGKRGWCAQNSLFFLPALAATALLVVPATAGAYATVEGPPIYSSAPGLPDGRVYEQVSPADKNGNEAGATTASVVTAEQHYALAAADGNSVLFEGTGPIGASPSPLSLFFVASKNKGAAGWSTRSVTPSPLQPATGLPVFTEALFQDFDPSADLSHAMFVSNKGGYASPPPPTCGKPEFEQGNDLMFLSGSDPFVPATWLERPAIEEPVENCAESGESGAPVGGTPDFSTIYFTYPGTLLPEDAPRAPHAHGRGEGSEVEAWGFYEDREGVLREAGVLPNNTLSPYGAVPAVSAHARALTGNQVSADGSRAFFVSPDPASCAGTGVAAAKNNCAADPPELYVRENGERTQLVSRDTLLPAAEGTPAAAPGGVVRTLNAVDLKHHIGQGVAGEDGSYVFASPDGSQAFFQSDDALTEAAQQASPGTEPKTYDFDVDTGALTYLPNVTGRIVATDADGSSFAFVRPEAGSSPRELDLWSTGPAGGSVTPVTQLPGAPEIVDATGQTAEVERVPLARMSSDGSVLVFATDANLSSGFNSGGFKQIYRYGVPANTLGCVSCPPHGVRPTASVSISPLQFSEENEEQHVQSTGSLTGHGYLIRGLVDERGISSDGDRIFFDTPDPLVPQDTNTDDTHFNSEKGVYEAQGRDVYEWENGVVYLISSGKSSVNSYFLDNSENGDDVFFATTEGLVPGDTDGAYDVYDARIPHPGDNPPPAAVPCEGSVCQGPPNVPSPLTPPASATFSGLGNPSPEATPTTATKTTTKTVKCKKGYVKKKNKCMKAKVKRKKAKKSTRGSK